MVVVPTADPALPVNSAAVSRRAALWTVQAGREQLSATGRFRALKAMRRRAAGAA